MKYPEFILIATGIFTGLMAGFFFSYSISVIPGLGKLTDSEYLRAMQNINRAVRNPIFLCCFFGVVLLLPYATFLHWKVTQTPFYFLLAATVLYLVGAFCVTIFVNVPLNDRLENFDLASVNAEDIERMREVFENRWNLWNNIRTVASLGSVVLVIIACIFNGPK